MPFERFTKTGRGFKPKVSIWNKGQIGFNQGSVQRYELEKYKYVSFFFDQNEGKIGFKFTNDQNEEGIAKLNTRTTGAVVSARAFLDYYNIDYSKTKKYDIDYDKENKLYVIRLDK